LEPLQREIKALDSRGRNALDKHSILVTRHSRRPTMIFLSASGVTGYPARYRWALLHHALCRGKNIGNLTSHAR
jgi:hypothetical protein